MSGCFGNNSIDRAMESQLNSYLDSQNEPEFYDSEIAEEVIKLTMEENPEVQGEELQKLINDALDNKFQEIQEKMESEREDYEVYLAECRQEERDDYDRDNYDPFYSPY